MRAIILLLPLTAWAAPPAPYSGHGAESVPPEVIEKYRAPALPSSVTRRIQATLDLRGPGAGVLAPDGKALYFGWTVTGVPQVWRVDGPMRFPLQLTGGEDSTGVVDVTRDGKRILVRRDRKGEENPGLYLQDAAGGPLVEIQHKAKVQTSYQGMSDDGRYAYFTANDLKPDSYAVYRWDLRDGKKETVFDQDGLWSIDDIRGDQLLLRKATGALTAELYAFDVGKRALTPLFGQGESEEYDARWGARPGEAVVLTNKLGEYRRLYSWVAGKLTPIGEEVQHDVEGFSVDSSRARVLYQVNEDGFTRLRGLDARGYKPIALPPLPESDHVSVVATTHDGRFTTFAIDDGRRPTQAFVYDWKARKLTRWHLPSTPEIDSTRFVRASLERYPARDGKQIPVLVRRPEKCAATPCPVVVQFHGGPEGQAKPGFNPFDQLFVDDGFIVVEPNVRGSSGYGKGWLHADDGAHRLEVITDIEDAARWARTRFAEGGKAPRVGIFGGSYGGYSVLVGMTMFAGSFDAGVDLVGISDLRTFLKNTAPYRRLLRISEYGDPERDAAVLAKLSPITYVERVKAPLLIMQGATDPRVPVGEALQIHQAVQQRGVPSQLIIFPDEGHGVIKRENRVAAIGHTLSFFEKHLLGK